MTKPKVYLAGGFKSNWQEKVVTQLKEKFIFLNPREHGLNDPKLYAAWDIHFVRECNILLGYMEKTNPSGYGLAFEVGLAYGLNKTIILVDERSPLDVEFRNYYQLIQFPCSAVFSSLEDGINFLERFSQ